MLKISDAVRQKYGGETDQECVENILRETYPTWDKQSIEKMTQTYMGLDNYRLVFVPEKRAEGWSGVCLRKQPS